jgi:deoxyribodipyrimidine photo-lyase
VKLGVDYPQPVVDLFKSASTHELIYNMAFNISSGGDYSGSRLTKKR